MTTVLAAASVFDRLVGQQRAVEALQHAVVGAHDTVAGGEGLGMTHAWLITGPPGSGRSVAARAFAAALQCDTGGCGTCHDCHTALIGTHPDVEVVTTEELSIGVELARSLVMEAAASPSLGHWRVIVVEDADRLTEQANNALLKAIEEPTPHTVWVLCAPSAEDVVTTVRSRCRHLTLVTPRPDDVAAHLVAADGVAPAMAAFAAQASQGHIGRARGLATDERTRQLRSDVLDVPVRVPDFGACLMLARTLVEGAEEEATQAGREREEAERSDLARSLGVERPSRPPKWAQSQFKDLKERQKRRAKRQVRDTLDRGLLDLVTFYRDVLAVQTGATVRLVNAERRSDVEHVARSSAPESTLRSIEAILKTRERIAANVAPLLALEDLMLSLRQS